MSLDENAIVLGLTGAFGSGCTTLATALETEHQFENMKISNLIIDAWRERQGLQDQTPLVMPPRGALQDLGDELRSKEKHHYWVQLAVERIPSDAKDISRLVLDGLRNPGEIEWLRHRFKRFFLVAVDAHPERRWLRLQRQPEWRDKGREDFDAISARDIEAPQEWGQRVQQCVDLADFVITNDDDKPRPAAQQNLLEKADDLLKLCDDTYRRPNDQEIFMYGAWSTAKASACLKRNVGAVIVKPGSKRPVAIGEEMREATQTAAPVGSGYNENPDWMSPCYQEYRACYRDIWREKTWASMNIEYCPYCKAEIADLAWPYKCPNPECPSAGSLLDTFFPERAMTKCTALHAEARAILSCQSADLTGCHLYCTTFPCFLCAQKILQAGIIRVIYVEPYPDKDSEELLRNHGIEVKRFEGVKALAFGKFFESWRANAEQKYSLSGGSR